MLMDFQRLFVKYNMNPKGVLHVGANVGEERDMYLSLGIKKQIWIEPNPEIFSKLIINVSNNPEATCLCLAAGNDTRIIPLNISNNAGQSSSILELGTHLQAHPEVHYTKTISVPMIRLIELLDVVIEDYDFLNIDAQGFEGEILKGMNDLLYKFKWLYLEVNKEPLYVGCKLVDEIDDYVKGYGFKRVETKWCGNTGWGDAIYTR